MLNVVMVLCQDTACTYIAQVAVSTQSFPKGNEKKLASYSTGDIIFAQRDVTIIDLSMS